MNDVCPYCSSIFERIRDDQVTCGSKRCKHLRAYEQKKARVFDLVCRSCKCDFQHWDKNKKTCGNDECLGKSYATKTILVRYYSIDWFSND